MLGVCMALIDDESEKQSFNDIYNKFYTTAYGVAMKILNNHAFAEDAVSEAFLRVAKSFHRIHDMDIHKICCFLVITVRNVSLNIYKKEFKNSKSVEYDDETYYKYNDVTFEEEQYGKLVSCLKMLPRSQRELLYLKYVFEMKSYEIGVVYGISGAAVSKRLKQALKNLEELMKRGEQD